MLTVVMPAAPAMAAPGTPGTPQAGTALFAEDFQNAAAAATPQLLTAYTGASGMTYTANSAWLTSCNGNVLSFNSPVSSKGTCSTTALSNASAQLAWAIGKFRNMADPATNNAVSAYTEAPNPGADKVQFQTTSNIPLPSSTGRFITFSVDTAAFNCGVSAPMYQFYAVNSAGTATALGSTVNACTSPTSVPVAAHGASAARTASVGTYSSNGSILFSGSSIGIRMNNANGSSTGNDAAFDNMQIIDATPQLDKSFSPALVATGGTSKLTFTVTNTTELAAKNGWSFTDALPAGLTVASPTTATTNCPAGVVTAVTGATSVGLAGNLSAGMASCTFSVNVTTNTPGTYTNDATNVALTGLNPPGSTSVVFATPGISVVKAAGTPVDVNANGLTDAGDTIPYTFAVTNTGPVALSGVAVSDPKAGAVTCPSTTLAAQASMNCTASYTITPADQTAGQVVNTATASGTPPTGPGVTSTPSSTTTPVQTPAPALTVLKSASPSGAADFVVGQEVTYTFLVTNTGNVPLADISVDETAFTGSGTAPVADCPTTPLAPNAQLTCTATYTLTQADVDGGSVSNTATATGIPPGTSTPPVSPPSTVEVPFDPAPSLTVVKTADQDEITAAGQSVTYSFRVTNTGNVTLDALTINETTFSGTGAPLVVDCPSTTVAPGAVVTCTATYTTTQADIDAGELSNAATATATPPDGPPVDAPPSDVTIPVTAAPSIALVKSATPSTVTTAGQQVSYSFLVTNTGNVTLSGVSITETAFTGTGTPPTVTCPAEASSLAPAADVTCTAAYAVTQADLDAGSVTNTATAAGTPPNGPASQSTPSTAIVGVQQVASLSVVKSATPDEPAAYTVGQEITYSFLVTNTGNLTLTDVDIDETAFNGSGTAPVATCPAGAAVLTPTSQVTCTATYTLTQDDIDRGTTENTAIATGVRPTGEDVTSTPSTAIVPALPAPGLTVTKTADRLELTEAGELIRYNFLVENTGNVTLTGVVLNETSFSGTGTAPIIECPGSMATLDPGEQANCMAVYTVTQADIDSGALSNAATGTGTPPDGPPVDSPPSEVTVPVTSAPALTIVKSVTPDDAATAGAQVSYTFLVTNSGNVTVTAVSIAETAFTGSGGSPTVTCPAAAASLAPGDDVTCTAAYTLTQADVDAGSVENTAVAQGSDPVGTPVESDPSSATVTAAAAPALTVAKTADVTDITAAGQEITYSFVVTNTGNVTLADVAVTETEFTGTGTLPVPTCPAGAASLAPTVQVTCTAVYTVTQADIDAGGVTNAASATGTPPGGGTPPVSPPSEVEVPSVPSPALTVAKTADVTNITAAGQEITYSFVVTNTGNVTLADVAVTETEFTGTGTLPTPTCPAGAASLAPTAQVTCTTVYTVTQADIDAGGVTNAASATGTPPGGGTPPVSPPSEVEVPSVPSPALTVAKTVAPTTVSSAGQSITYSFVVTNTGNVTLTDVAVVEGAFSGTGALGAISCPADELAPEDAFTCTAAYVVTQADVDAGSLENTATATGTPPGDSTPIDSPPSTALVPIVPAPALTIVKSAAYGDDYRAGQVVDYSFVATNTGNVTLTDVTVTETEFTGSGTAPVPVCPAGAAELAPGTQVICTATYTVTQADVDAGSISNAATATGVPPGGGTPPVSPPSVVEVPELPAPALTVVKTTDTQAVTRAGQAIDYRFTVTNTGNVTLSTTKVNEVSFSGAGAFGAPVCPAGALVPGQVIVCTATYTVVTADLTGKPLVNTATATGTPPGGDPITSDPSTVRITDVAKAPADVLPWTGAELPWGAGLLAILLLLGGGGALLAARLRSRETA
ncbi:hypothetical protein ACIQTX_19235 [Microbacterium sp. NPDC090281]|uniref:DUF7507 domain-containing protein n=1 Tax=Microbacterium sp. NPDC090281 TaxID=3364208 RepID=UPI0037FC2C1D